MPRNKACQQIQNLSKIGSECFRVLLLIPSRDCSQYGGNLDHLMHPRESDLSLKQHHFLSSCHGFVMKMYFLCKNQNAIIL